MARALRMMKEFAASASTAAISDAACSTPAAASTESSVASPSTDGYGQPVRRSVSMSSTTRGRPASLTSDAIERPTRPHPQMTT